MTPRPSLKPQARLSLLAALPAFWTAAALGQVEVLGVGEEIAANVRAHLKLDEETCGSARWRVEREYSRVDELARQALRAYGYYGAEVTREIEFGEECWHAVVRIAAGDPVRLREVDIELAGEAATDPRFRALLADSGLNRGDPLRHAVYEQFKSEIQALARNRGYPRAVLETARIDVYPAENAADVTVSFDSGPRYDFGRIELRQDAFVDELIRGYVTFDSGQPYEDAELTETYLALSNSGFFSRIDLRPLPADHENETIPVLVSLTTGPPREISYGVGFSTDTGPRVRFDRNNRRFNDRGHQFEVNSELSPVMSEVQVSYRYPYGDPRSEWMSFSGGVAREKTDTSESESLEFGVRRVREGAGLWTRTQFVTLLVEDFVVSDQSGLTRLLMPGIEWARLEADDTIRPERGSRISFELRAAAEELGSNTSFAQVIANGKWIWTLPGGGRFLVRGRVGLTAEERFEELPPSVRFFAGGDNSVRGYAFKSLGPTDEAGEVIGGSGLMTASVEYEYPVKERWSVAFFVDSGNAIEGTDFEARTGAGIGARWISPLGPVRIDIGVPIDDPDNDARLHVTLGPDL